MAIYSISTADTNIEWGLTGGDKIAQNVLNILRTKQSEVPFMREMGIDPDYLDNTIPYIKSNITSSVISLVEEYEPRATVINVQIDSVGADGQFVIDVEVEV